MTRHGSTHGVCFTAELPNNVYTTCHRPSCDNRFTMPFGDLNMPPPFKDYHRTDVWAEDRKALRAWCEEEASPDRYQRCK